jgi:hypothetical protein
MDVVMMVVFLFMYFQDIAPPIESPFLPGDVWRKEFIDKGFCNGLTEEKLCYQVAKYLVGDDPTNINYVSNKYLHNLICNAVSNIVT